MWQALRRLELRRVGVDAGAAEADPDVVRP
jgi:hypothetical protein